MSSGTEPLAHIVALNLPEDTKCGHPAQIGGCFCAVRTGGDTLAGTFTIKLYSNQRQLVDLYFEGICRTWLPDTDIRQVRAYEHRFLLQIQCLETMSLSTAYAATWPALQTTPFAFKIPCIIPAELAGNIPLQNQSYHSLYPSADIGRAYFNSADDKVFAQPLIKYTLSASIRRGAATRSFRDSLSRRIKVIPTTTDPPPIATTLFESEYVRVARANLRNGFYGRSFGSLEFSADEPQVIHLPEQFSQSQTTVFVRIVFQHIRNGVKLKTIPYDWKFEVSSRLQRRVFCATHPLARMPTIAEAIGSSEIGLRTEILSVEKQRYDRLTWRNIHTSPHGKILLSDNTAASWIATIPIKVSIDSSLLPSFFCAICSLRYSILLEIRAVGPWSSTSSLAVPVQVISLARKMSQPEVDTVRTPDIQLGEFPNSDFGAAQGRQPPDYY